MGVELTLKATGMALGLFATVGCTRFGGVYQIIEEDGGFGPGCVERTLVSIDAGLLSPDPLNHSGKWVLAATSNGPVAIEVRPHGEGIMVSRLRPVTHHNPMREEEYVEAEQRTASIAKALTTQCSQGRRVRIRCERLAPPSGAETCTTPETRAGE
jgi:hypothetical protein